MSELKHIENFENFNKKNYSFNSINKFFKKNEAFNIEEIENFIKDTVAWVGNGGKGFFVTKEIYNNDSDSLELTISKKIDYFMEKIKINNNDNDDKAKKYKYVTLKSIIMGILFDISYKRYNFIPTSPFEENKYKNKLRDWVPDDTPDILNIYNGAPIKFNKNFKINEKIIEPFLYHIKEILADNIDTSYNFILNMLAHMVQKPNIKTEVCMVFISSSEGAGKNIFWDNFSNKIIGKKYSAHINDLDTLMGPFNSILSNKIITILDEVKTKFGGKSSDRFKSMVTTNMFNLNQKGVDNITMNDYNNYIILSNNDIPVNISESDRRFFVSNVSNKKVNDQTYFTNLGKLWDDKNIVENFYHYLCNIDITNFKPQRQIPITYRKIEIKQETITSPINFLIEIAKNNVDDIIGKSSDDVYDKYVEYCYEHFEVKPYRKIDFFKKINKFIDKPEINSERKKIYILSKNVIKDKLQEIFKVSSMDCFKEIQYTISSDDEPNNPDNLTYSESSSSNEEEYSDTSQTSQEKENNNLQDLQDYGNQIEKVKGQIGVYKVIINGKTKFGTYDKLKKLQNEKIEEMLNF